MAMTGEAAAIALAILESLKDLMRAGFSLAAAHEALAEMASRITHKKPG